jgi:hypothetical protein
MAYLMTLSFIAQNPRYPKERDRNRQYTFLTKLDGTEVKTATPSEVADTYLSNADTNRFKEEDKSKLEQCLPVEVLTQEQYNAIIAADTDDTETLYVIIG